MSQKILFHFISKLFSILSLFLFLFTFVQSPAFGARNATRSTRETLIRRATTGSSTSPTSFSAHVDNILSTTSDAARGRVDTEFKKLEKITTEEDTLPDYYISPALPRSNSGLGFEELEEDETAEDQEENASGPLGRESLEKQQIHSDEETYQFEQTKAIEKLEEDEKKRKSEDKRNALESDKQSKESEESSVNKENLRPSLKNNPFYFGQDAAKQFSDLKPIVVSRLVQEGYTRLEADNIVLGTASKDELVLVLMRQEGYDYGESLNLVSG